MEGSESIVVFDEYGPVRMIRTREWKYVHRYPYGPHELYHLAGDPGERMALVISTNPSLASANNPADPTEATTSPLL